MKLFKIKGEKQTLGTYIRSRRVEVGLTQEELGRMLGHANGQAISNYEAGRASVPRAHYAALAKALKLKADVLITKDVAEYEDELRRVVGA